MTNPVTMLDDIKAPIKIFTLISSTKSKLKTIAEPINGDKKLVSQLPKILWAIIFMMNLIL